MNIKNVVFDAGGVLLEWNPPRFIAQVFPDAVTQALVRREVFEHADWQEFDRGTLSESAAAEIFAKRTGLTVNQMLTVIRTGYESLQPIPGTMKLLDDLVAAGIHLYLLSNMPASTFEFLVKKHKFFAHFKELVISGAILMMKPEPAIYKHLVEKTGIVPAESVFIDDLLRNVVAARESGLHAIQFFDPDSCRQELRTYLPKI